MEQTAANEAVNALADLGTSSGLIGAVTAATHITKSIAKRVPVPPIALVFGLAGTVVVWRAGLLDLGIAPIGATVWEWGVVAMWSLPLVLSAMGLSSVIERPGATIRRGSGDA